MKKIILFLLCLGFVLSNPVLSIAQTKTPTPTTKSTTSKVTPTAEPSDAEEIDRVQKIKQLVASKVAELKLVEKRGILGTVKEKTNTTITLEDDKETVRIVDIDELTKFEDDGDDTFGISDVEAGQTISAIGLYNKDTKRLLGRFVSKVDNIPTTLSAIVVSKDLKNFTLTVATDTGEKIIDIASSTKMSLYSEGELIKSGFTKILEGERVFAVGFDDLKIKNQLNASRLIHFDKLSPSSKMKESLAQKDIEAETTAAPTTKPLKETTK